MIRFNARGTSLRWCLYGIYLATSREGAYSKQGAYLFCFKTVECAKQGFGVQFWKRKNCWNWKINRYTVELLCDLPWYFSAHFFQLIDNFWWRKKGDKLSMQWKQETGAGKGSLGNKWNDPFADMGGKGGTYGNVIFFTGWGGGGKEKVGTLSWTTSNSFLRYCAELRHD